MSSGCGDVLSLADLQTAKKHQIFEAEVITGKSGGVAGGANIDYATNSVTGQVQKTLPAVLRDIGFSLASFTFETGGTLSESDVGSLVFWPSAAGGDNNYYVWNGEYPKTIPASSTPASTGGVSETAWTAVMGMSYMLAANSLSEIAGLGASAQEEAIDNIGLGPTYEAIKGSESLSGLSSPTDGRTLTIVASANTSDVFLVPSYFALKGAGLYTYRAGRSAFPVISKSGNATYNFVNEDLSAVDVDAVVAVDPTWIDGRWPQQTEFNRLAIVGDRTSFNQAGLYLMQGSYYKVRDCSFSACKHAILIRDSWVGEFTNVYSWDGAFYSSRGTSQRWSGCYAAGHADVIGAYHFKDTTYSTLTSCASDHAPRGAYFFEGGCEITMVSCGTEFPTTTDTAIGTMVALNGGNKITCIGFKGVPNASQTQPLISVGANDLLHIINWNSYQPSYPNSLDISINGDGSTVIVEDGEFSGTATGNTAFPRVQFRGDYQNSRVILKYKHKEYIYKCPTGGGFVNTPEEMRSTATFTPTLLVNNAVNAGLTYTSATARYTKNGNQVQVSWDITVAGLSGISTSATIKLLLPSSYPSGAASTGNYIISGASSFTPGSCYQDGANQYVFLYSNAASELTAANISNGTRIRGSITYLSKDTGWV